MECSIVRWLRKYPSYGECLTQRRGNTDHPATENKVGFLQVLLSPERSLRRTSLKMNISGTSTTMFKGIGGLACKTETGQRLNNRDKHYLFCFSVNNGLLQPRIPTEGMVFRWKSPSFKWIQLQADSTFSRLSASRYGRGETTTQVARNPMVCNVSREHTGPLLCSRC